MQPLLKVKRQIVYKNGGFKSFSLDTATDAIDLTCVDTNCCAAKHYLSGADVLYGTSLESGPQGSGIPAGDFSGDVIDFLVK